MKKKIITREEFEEVRKRAAEDMRYEGFGSEIRRRAVELIGDSTYYKQVHQMNWMNEPTLQLPQDLFAIQEVIRKYHPSMIFELGVCWGGTTLFLSSVQTEIGGGMVMGIDVFMPDDLRKRIDEKNEDYYLSTIKLVEGSSVSQEIVGQVRDVYNEYCGNVLVIVDTNHTEKQVLKELQIYSEFANYMVVCDTIVEDLSEPEDRPWGPGNSPRTALNKFLEKNKDWERDEEICNKLLFSCQPDGFIKKKGIMNG